MGDRESRDVQAGDDPRPQSRRTFLARSGGAVAGASALGGFLAACGGSSSSSTSAASAPAAATTAAATTAPATTAAISGQTLNILTWEGYHQQPWLADFTKATGVKVNATNVGAPAEMFAKVKAAPDQFDIVYCTAGWFDNYVKDGLLLEIDEARAPNIKLIADVFPWRQATSVGGKSYGVLYNWGDVPLGWRVADVPGKLDVSAYLNGDGVPYDWNILWDPQFKGKVSMFDSPTDVFPMIGLAAGLKNPYVLTDAQLATVKTKLMELRPQIRRLTSGFDDQTSQFVTGEAIIGYLNNALVDVEVNKKVKFKSQHVMKQGTPAWSDNASVTTGGGGKKLDAVYAFIDYELAVPWQARFVAASGNNGTLDYDQATSGDATAAGLTAAKLAATLIPSSRDAGFFPALVFYKATNVLQKQLDIWNEFKLGIGG